MEGETAPCSSTPRRRVQCPQRSLCRPTHDGSGRALQSMQARRRALGRVSRERGGDCGWRWRGVGRPRTSARAAGAAAARVAACRRRARLVVWDTERPAVVSGRLSLTSTAVVAGPTVVACALLGGGVALPVLGAARPAGSDCPHGAVRSHQYVQQPRARRPSPAWPSEPHCPPPPPAHPGVAQDDRSPAPGAHAGIPRDPVRVCGAPMGISSSGESLLLERDRLARDESAGDKEGEPGTL